jgi:hypothetical protein
MRKLVIGLVAVAAFAVAGPASAGGWATAGLGPPDGGLGAGDTWKAEVTVLQHGQTPLVGVQPAVIIRNLDNGAERRFAARPTDKPGVYLASVKLPSGGEWRYFVDDGFGQTHSFSTFQVAGGSGGGGSGLDLPVWPLAIAALMAVAVLLALFARRARPRTAPAAH